MLPAFVMNEIPIRIGLASGNDATTSQEPDRHASPASSGSDVPQEWVSNLKDQRPRCYDARSQYFPQSVMARHFLFFLST